MCDLPVVDVGDPVVLLTGSSSSSAYSGRFQSIFIGSRKRDDILCPPPSVSDLLNKGSMDHGILVFVSLTDHVSSVKVTDPPVNVIKTLISAVS